MGQKRGVRSSAGAEESTEAYIPRCMQAEAGGQGGGLEGGRGGLGRSGKMSAHARRCVASGCIPREAPARTRCGPPGWCSACCATAPIGWPRAGRSSARASPVTRPGARPRRTVWRLSQRSSALSMPETSAEMRGARGVVGPSGAEVLGFSVGIAAPRGLGARHPSLGGERLGIGARRARPQSGGIAARPRWCPWMWGDLGARHGDRDTSRQTDTCGAQVGTTLDARSRCSPSRPSGMRRSGRGKLELNDGRREKAHHGVPAPD